MNLSGDVCALLGMLHADTFVFGSLNLGLMLAQLLTYFAESCYLRKEFRHRWRDESSLRDLVSDQTLDLVQDFWNAE